MSRPNLFASDQTITGTRVAYDGAKYPRGTPEDGNDIFTASGHAGDITLQRITATNIGALLAIPGHARAVLLEDITLTNSYIGVDAHLPNTASVYSVVSFTARRCTSVDNERGLFQLRFRCGNVLIEDCSADQGVVRAGDSFAEMFHLVGAIDGAVIRRCTALRAWYNGSGSFWNSDGFCSERPVTNLTYEDNVAMYCTDGGHDDKASPIAFYREHCELNSVNFKLWGAVIYMEDCKSINPHKYGGSNVSFHFRIDGEDPTPGTMTLVRPYIRADAGNLAPIFHQHRTAPVTVSITDWDIQVDPDTPIVFNSFGAAFDITWSPALPTINASLTWRGGFTNGNIPEGTAVGTALADIGSSTAGTLGGPTLGAGAVVLDFSANADNKFEIVGTELRLKNALNRAVKTSHAATIRAYPSNGLAKATISFTATVTP